MRITLLTQWFDPEPAPIPGLTLASWLAGRGHRVEVLTGFPNYPAGATYPGYRQRLCQREDVSGLRIIRVPLYPSHDRSPVRRAVSYGSFTLSASTVGSLVVGRSDVVCMYNPPTLGLPAMMWRKLRGTPFVYHVTDIWPDSATQSGMITSASVLQWVNRSLSWWCNQVYNRAGAIIVISQGFKRLLIERGVPDRKITVVPNWTDESVFRPMPPNTQLAKELGFDGHFNIVYAGNLGEYQGLEAAIRAASDVRHLTGLQLVLIGTGPAEAALRDYAGRLGVSNVRFIGQRDFRDMGDVANLADVHLVTLQDLPLFSATIPSKTQAAMSTGKPVVMAVSGDAAHMIEQAGCGIACRPGDHLALASAYERMYGMEASELQNMGDRGRQFYLERLSLASAGQRIESLLLRVARTTPPEELVADTWSITPG